MEIITETIYGYDSSVMKKIENRKVSPNSNSRREAESYPCEKTMQRWHHWFMASL